MAEKRKNVKKGIGLIPNSSSDNAVKGDLESLTSDGKLYYHNGSVNDAVVSETTSATLTNKTLTSPILTTPNIGAATGTSLSVSGQLTSTVATGTAPLVVSSTTRVANLNVATAGNADTVTTNANLTGDITSVGNATTLATVNSNVGSFGSSTSIPNLTVNAKGLITAAGSNVVIAPAGTLSGTTLNSTVVSSSLTSVGTLVNLTVTNPITGSITGNAATVTTNANLTGDVTSSGNATTLATVNSNVGSFTNANITVNGKGLITAAASGTASSLYALTSVSNTYSILTTDYTVLCDATGGGYTVTLPTAVGVNGKTYVIKKTDSSFNIVVVATTSSQTIDGVTTKHLSTKGETLTLQSNGSGWEILVRTIPGNWANYTLTIGATVTPPTPGTNTAQARWRRVHDAMEIQYFFSQTGAGSGGSGTYLFPIVSGVTIDTSKVSVSTAAIGTGGTVVGNGMATSTTSANSNGAGTTYVIPYDTSNLAMYTTTTTAGQITPIGSSGIPLGSADRYYSFKISVPIANWEG